MIGKLVDGSVVPLSDADLVQQAVDAEAEAARQRDRLLAHARQKRLEREAAGAAMPGGLVVAADTESIAKIESAHSAFQDGLISSVDFKARSGWVTVPDATMMAAVRQAVVLHVQQGYSLEKQAADAIAAGTATTMADIDAIFASS
jgi:hypothetical protein